MKNPTSSNEQWAALAFSRFVLATCVLMTHSGIVAPNDFFARHFWGTGYPAVFGFFMISGYSIAASLASRPDGYFARRVRRIYPTYLCALALSVLILIPHPLRLPQGQLLILDDWKTILFNVFMLQGIASESVTANGAIWSLSIEWWCYMLAMVLVRVGARWTVALIAISFASLMVYMHHHGLLFGDSDMPRFGVPLLTLAWGWLTGFLFYRQRSVFTFALMLLLPLLMFERGIRLPLSSLVIAASAVIVYFAKDLRVRNRSLARTMQWLGDMSYPLYLFHPPLLFALSSHGIIRDGNVMVVAILAIVSCGYFVGCRVMNGLAAVFGVKRDKMHTPSVSLLDTWPATTADSKSSTR
ncbi:acyltransferase family protein [Paraburkholderia tropica]|uniref:acyltransferase family protein n=1 Tax=Paraburkholderia tropica TaxID=92647 RepID=UPI002AB214D8|nr:acyltransferase [Paraburkholderia tropica]